MYNFIRGRVCQILSTSIVLDNNGIGYLIYVLIMEVGLK